MLTSGPSAIVLALSLPVLLGGWADTNGPSEMTMAGHRNVLIYANTAYCVASFGVASPTAVFDREEARSQRAGDARWARAWWVVITRKKVDRGLRDGSHE